MKSGLSWCWNRVSGLKSKKGHELPVCSPTKRKTSFKNGFSSFPRFFVSLFLFFFSLRQKKGPGYYWRKRARAALDRGLLSRLSSDVLNRVSLSEMGNKVASGRVLNVF